MPGLSVPAAGSIESYTAGRVLFAGADGRPTEDAGITYDSVAQRLAVAKLRVSSLTPNGFLVCGADGEVQTTAAATDGQVLIGRTGNTPVAATLTPAANITITNGAGTITIAGAAATTLNTLSGDVTLAGTANQITVGAPVGQTITLSLPQSIATASTPQFARLGLGGAAGTDPLAITTAAGASGFTTITNALGVAGPAATNGSGTYAYLTANGVLGAGTTLYLYQSGGYGVNVGQAAITSQGDAVHTLGTASVRWKQLFLGGTTVTTSTPLLQLDQTWNAGAVAFTAILLNVTSPASAAASLLLDLQVGSASKFSVDKTGVVTTQNSMTIAAGGRLTLINGNSYIERNGGGADILIASPYADPNGKVFFQINGAATRMEINGFGQLLVTGGTLTTTSRPSTFTQTWNDGAVTFTALKASVTDTASAAASLLLDLLVGAASKFKVDKAGNVTAVGAFTAGGGSGAMMFDFGFGTYGYAYNSTTGDIRIKVSNAGQWGFAYGVGATGFFKMTSAGGVTFGNAASDAGLNDANITTTITQQAAGIIQVGTSAANALGSLALANLIASGYLQLAEMTAPAGAADKARLCAQDNGAGKTQLMVIFPTGAAIQLAIEA